MSRPLPPLEIPLEPRGAHEEFSLFKPPEGEAKIQTSPQLLLATHRFLSRGWSSQPPPTSGQDRSGSYRISSGSVCEGEAAVLDSVDEQPDSVRLSV